MHTKGSTLREMITGTGKAVPLKQRSTAIQSNTFNEVSCQRGRDRELPASAQGKAPVDRGGQGAMGLGPSPEGNDSGKPEDRGFKGLEPMQWC